MTKNILRKKFSNLSVNEYDNHTIIDNAVKLIEKHRPKVVGIYIMRKNEIDLMPIVLKINKIIFTVPKIRNDEIFFTSYYPGAQLEPNEQYPSYFEPVSDNIIIPDLIFIPGIAFDIKGYRLGLGKGHYDKYLACHNVVKIGICRGDNLLTSTFPEKHDIKMDYIITEDIILSLI